MCHCIFFRINPRVSKHHAFHHHRATHTTHGVFYAAVLPPGSPGAICLTVPQWRLRLPAAQGDIRQSIIPRGFRALPDDIREVVDAYFHRQELEDRANRVADDDQEMSTDTEATVTVRRLQVSDPVATTLLQRARHDTLMPATAPRPQHPEEFYYDSDDSILDLDEEYPGLGEHIIAASHMTGHCFLAGVAPA